jgi:ATP-dependent RNA helicase RhlE
LGLQAPWAAAAREQGWTQPTPVQLQAIPAVLQGRDVLACAQTGSGKTAAFALPLLQTIGAVQAALPADAKPRTLALVLAPTRELVAQIGEVMTALCHSAAPVLNVASVFGGAAIEPQMAQLRCGAQVVVATPGRLLDLLQQRALSLGKVRMLVLDEADRLLEAGFADELGQIMALLGTKLQASAKCQTLLFSATFPKGVTALADALLTEPVRIDIERTELTAPDIAEHAICVDAPLRTQLLRHLVTTQQWQRVMVFVATKYAAHTVAHKLYRAGVNAAAFHGELSQAERAQTMEDFKAGRWQVLVTTDLASRGIDVAELDVVVQYDLPRSPADYTHRIGRTARAGANGLAVAFITEDSAAHFAVIEKRRGNELARDMVEGFEPSFDPHAPLAPVASTAAHDGTGGVKGKRPSKKDKLRAAAAAAAAAASADATAAAKRQSGAASEAG